MLIKVSKFVFGTGFDPFYAGSSHTIIRGCAASAAALAIQIVNYRVLFSIRLGRYLAMAVLIRGKLHTGTSIHRLEYSHFEVFPRLTSLAFSQVSPDSCRTWFCSRIQW